MENGGSFNNERYDNHQSAEEREGTVDAQSIGDAAIRSANMEKAATHYDVESVKEKIEEIHSTADRSEADSLLGELKSIEEWLEEEGKSPTGSPDYVKEAQEEAEKKAEEADADADAETEDAAETEAEETESDGE